MDNLIPINIVIGDRSYRIRIAQADEETVRKTLKTINDKLIEYKTQFAGKDMQDYVAMVLLWYATQLQVPQNSSALTTDLEHSLAQMELLLDKVLQK